MPSRNCLGAVAAIVVIGATGAAAAAPSTPAATVDAFHQALANGDAAGAKSLLAEDVIIFEEGYVERSRAEYEASHLPADMAFSGGVSRTLNKREVVADGSTAWVLSESRVTGTFRDKAVDKITVETMALTATPDGWRIRHIHWSARDPKAD